MLVDMLCNVFDLTAKSSRCEGGRERASKGVTRCMLIALWGEFGREPENGSGARPCLVSLMFWPNRRQFHEAGCLPLLEVSSASIRDGAPTPTSTALLQFSTSKFPRENHAVKVSKDAFSLVVDYYKDNVSKDRAYFRKSIVLEISHAFKKTHCFVNCSEISEKFRELQRTTRPDPTCDRARCRYLTIYYYYYYHYYY
jgi:hypothetical protein